MTPPPAMEPPFEGELHEEESGPSLDLKVLLLYGVFRSKLWVVALVALGTFGGLVVGAAQPNEYASVAKLWYRPGEREAQTEEDLAGVESEDRRRYAPGLTDEILILDHEPLYEQVARQLGPSWVLAPPDPEQYDDENTSLPVRWMHRLQKALIEAKGPGNIDDQSELAVAAAAHRLKADTQLVPLRGSSIISVVHKAQDKQKAQRINQALVDAFRFRHQQVFGAEQRVDEQQASVDQAQIEVDEANEQWDEYRKVCGVPDFDTEWEQNRLRLEQLQSARDEKEGSFNQLSAQIERLRERLDGMPPEFEEKTAAVMMENPVWTDLNNEKMELEKQLLLLPDSGIGDIAIKRRTQQLESQIQSLDERLAEVPREVEKEGERVKTVPNDAWYDLDARLAEMEAQLYGLAAAVEDLEAKIVDTRERRDRVLECRDDHLMHERKVKRLEETLEAERQRLENITRMASLDQAGESNLTVTSEPSFPKDKVGPNRLKPLLAGFAGGAALGVALAALRQLLDRRLRYPETVEKGLGVKVLAVVPELRRLRSLPKAKSPSAA